MATLTAHRLAALHKLLAAHSLDVLLVTHPADWYYLTGFSGDSGALLVSRTDSALMTDGRFTVQARQQTSGVRILLQSSGLHTSVGEFIRRNRWKRIGYDPVQATVAQMAALRKTVGPGSRFVPAPGLPAGLRIRKDAAELAQMRRAAGLADEVMLAAIRLLKPGIRELDVAAEIDYRLRRRGASGPAFETIVAFGVRAALPHARPTAKRLRKNELVVLDLGAILGHYCSDMTRTVYAGRAPARIRLWYAAVIEAQRAAIAATRSGVTCGEVDAAARGVLARHKLDRYFVHSTGHGLGLEVHEDPRVARGQEQRLESSFVITVEPGVYVPGVGGIRIEDDVAILSDGHEVLTRAPRDFIEI
jgi:Xaa-Pro aminopeptidase